MPTSQLRGSCRTAAVLLTGLLVAQSPALSQPASSGFVDAAEPLIQEGRKAQWRGDTASLRESVRLFNRALPRLDTSVYLTRIGSVLNSIGVSYRQLDEIDSARVYYTRAVEVRRRVDDPLGLGISLYNLGMVLYEQRNADSALVYLRAALDVKQRLRDSAGQGAALAGIAMVHQLRGRADSAQASLDQATPLALQARDSSALATVYEVRAWVLRTLNRPDSAAVYYQKAIAIHQRQGNRRGELAMEVSGGSLAEIAALARLADELGSRGIERGRANALDQIGTVHRKYNRPDSALAYHRQALAIQLRIGDRGGQAATLSHIADVFREQLRRDSAVVYYSRALPALREVQDVRGVANAMVHLGALHEFVPGRHSLARSVAYYDSAAAIIGDLGRTAGSDPNWVSFAESDVVLYHLWVIAWMRREREVGARRAAFAALAASERGRAQALRYLMRRNASGQAPAAPAAKPPRPGDVSAEGRDLARSLSRGGVSTLSYQVTGYTLFAFLIRPNGQVEVFRTPVRQEVIAAYVHGVVRGVLAERKASDRRGEPEADEIMAPPGDTTTSTDWRVLAGQLSRLLFPAELLARLPPRGELAIVPSGALFQLPFAVLPLGRAGEAETLLGVRYALRFAPSLQVLAELEGRPPVQDLTAAPLVVGDPTMPRHPTLGPGFLKPLLAARSEAERVASLVNTHALTGDAATESAVRARLGGATLVHFATHARAFASDSLVRESYIAFAPGDGHDGFLTVGELLDGVAEMNAELVVLSACQTGRGGLKQAEGTVGLQRAFLARGARGLMVSLWEVDDDASAMLMREFYQNLGKRKSRAESLRLAQIAVMEEYPKPWAWAAFQLVGVR